MKLSQFKFKLPEEQIAQFPAPYREDARMLVLHRKTGEIEHKSVSQIVDYFTEGDLFVFNDTQVFPARMYAKKEKTMANIEVFLLRELNHENRYWDVLVDPARKIRIGNKLFFDEDTTIVAEVIDNTTSRGRTLRFLTDYNNEEFINHLYALGTTPLPKYIKRPMYSEVQEEYEKAFGEYDVAQMDEERYQSIFASKVGAVAKISWLTTVACTNDTS
jgi:S-adenosylmethionine:tRNA ribosyltransferase-isomerase